MLILFLSAEHTAFYERKMQMKKPIAAVLLFALLLFTSACGGNSALENESETESASQSTRETESETTPGEETTEDTQTLPLDTTSKIESKTNAPETEKQNTGGIGEYLQKYVIDVIETGRYTMTVQAVSSGLKMDYVGVISGENTMQEMNMLGMMTIRLISKDGKCYLLSPKGKKYTEISFDEFEKQLKTIKNFSLEFKELTLTDTATVEKGNKEYVVETYKNPKGSISKYYFRNNSLEFIELTEGGKTEERKYTISPEIDESRLSVPSDYKRVDNPGDVLLG